MAVSKINKKSGNEFEQYILDVARVARVVAGGKRLSFRATVAVGNKTENLIGIGVGKGKDVTQAIEKAVYDAKKNLVKVPIKEGTIPFETRAKYKAAEIILKPSQKGKGIIAGGTVRNVLKLTNINDVTAKILGKTGNPINNARATIEAIKKLNIKED